MVDRYSDEEILEEQKQMMVVSKKYRIIAAISFKNCMGTIRIWGRPQREEVKEHVKEKNKKEDTTYTKDLV